MSRAPVMSYYRGMRTGRTGARERHGRSKENVSSLLLYLFFCIFVYPLFIVKIAIIWPAGFMPAIVVGFVLVLILGRALSR
jgi:hypothetical protein